MPHVTTHCDTQLLAELDKMGEFRDMGHGTLHRQAAAEIRRLDALIPPGEPPSEELPPVDPPPGEEIPPGSEEIPTGLQLPPNEPPLTSDELEEIVGEEIEEQEHEAGRHRPTRGHSRPRHRR